MTKTIGQKFILRHESVLLSLLVIRFVYVDTRVPDFYGGDGGGNGDGGTSSGKL